MFTSVSCVRVVSHTGLAVVDTAATTISQSDRKADRQAGSQRISHIVYILEIVSYMFVVELYHPYTIVPFIFNK